MLPASLRRLRPAPAGLAALLLLAPAASSLAQQAPGAAPATGSAPSRGAPLRIGGSSTVFPFLEEAIKAYRAAGQVAGIELQESGTSDGMRRFCAGQLMIANASRPISAKEIKACQARGISFLELPIAFDALTVVVHPSNSWARSISSGELARLWGRPAQGVVDRWSEVNSRWPQRPIRLCGPGSDSGSFDYFNKAINGDATNSRSDYTSSEDDNVLVRCVASNPEALGYFGFSYYKANATRLRALAIGAPGSAVAPTLETVQSGRYQPLSRPLFLYVNDRALAERPELQRFVSFTVRRGLLFAQRARMIPLPSSTYQLVESKLYRRISGSAFAGDLPVGLTIGEALRRSFDQTKRPQFR